MRAPTVLSLPVLLLSLPFSVFADVKFTAPAAGSEQPAGAIFTVSWADSGAAPAIVDLTKYNLFLYSGSNAKPQQLYAFPLPATDMVFTKGNSVKVSVPAGIGGPGTNVYFIGIQSTAAAGGDVTNFSPRFTITGMTGTFSAAVIASNAGISGTAGPPTVKNLAGAQDIIDQGAWGIPYNQQEGPTRYAPMQPIPGTKITATNTKPLWPTSNVPTATTFLPVLGTALVTTQTQPQTFSAASHANTAAPQSQPMDDMAKYLNRWKD